MPKKDYYEEIVSILAQSKEPLTATEIATKLGISYPTVYKYVIALEKMGQVERVLKPKDPSIKHSRAGVGFKVKSIKEAKLPFLGKYYSMDYAVKVSTVAATASVLGRVEYLKEVSNNPTASFDSIRWTPDAYTLLGLAPLAFNVAESSHFQDAFPNQARDYLRQAIKKHQEQIDTLTAIINNPLLWDRKDNKEVLSSIMPVGLDKLRDAIQELNTKSITKSIDSEID